MTTNPESVHRHDPEVNRAFIALMDAQEGLPKFAVALAVNDPARPAPPPPAEVEPGSAGTVTVAPKVVTFRDFSGDTLKVGATRAGSDASSDFLLISVANPADPASPVSVAVPFSRWSALVATVSQLMKDHTDRENRRRP